MKTIPTFTPQRLFLYLILSLFALTAWSQPVIFRVTETAFPGDVIALYGYDFGASPRVFVEVLNGNTTPDTTQLVVLTKGEGPDFVTARIPDDFPFGLYAVRIRNAEVYSSEPALINRAYSWGALDLCGDEVAPGQSFRLFGRNLRFPGQSPAVRFVDLGDENNQLNATVDLEYGDDREMRVTAPSGLSEGTNYKLFISNGYAGTTGEVETDINLTACEVSSDPFGLEVPWAGVFDQMAENHPANCFDVTDSEYGEYRAIPNDGLDDSKAIQEAINAASASSNGGIVYFPAGTYLISGQMIELKSNVVLQGQEIAGEPASIISVDIPESSYPSSGFYGWNLENIGFYKIWIRNSASSRTKRSVLIEDSYRIFAREARFESEVEANILWVGNQQVLVKDCEFVANQQSGEGNTFEHPIYIAESRYVVIKDNHIDWYFKRILLNRSLDILIENNDMTRHVHTGDGPNEGDEVPSGGMSISWNERVAVLRNTIDREGDGPLKVYNDGESIMAEGPMVPGGPLQPCYGTIIGIVPETGTITVPYGDWKGELPTPYGKSYYLHIVSGIGAGQYRRIETSTDTPTTTEFTFDQLWSVNPDQGSRYAINPMVLYHALIKGNKLSEHRQGIFLYDASCDDIAIVGNTLTDNGRIYLRTRYDDVDDLPRFTVMHGVLVENNKVTNEPYEVTEDGPVYLYEAIKSQARINAEATIQTDITEYWGTSYFGLEIRNNLVDAPVPDRVDGRDGEGFGALVLHRNDGDPETAVIPGAIFQDNHAIDTKDAFRLSTGAHGTVIWNNSTTNVDTLLLDIQESNTGVASTGTVLGDQVAEWNFESQNGIDSSGNGFNLSSSVSPFPSSTDVPDLGSGNSFSVALDGTSYLTAPVEATLVASDDFTIDFWVKADPSDENLPAYARAVSLQHPDANSGWEIQRPGSDSDCLAIRLDTSGGSNQIKAEIEALTGEWHHVAWVVNRGRVSGYLDREKVVEDTYSHGDGFLSDDYPALRLGARYDGNARFVGNLDNVTYFQSDQSLALDRVVEWNFESSIDYDSSGNDFHLDSTAGTPSRTDVDPPPSAGDNFYSLELDGYSYLSASVEAKLVDSDDFTIAFWVKADPSDENLPAYARAVSLQHPDANLGWEIQRPGSDSDCLAIRLDTSGGSNQVKAEIEALTGEWHHVAWLVNQGQVYGYLDGVKVVEDTYNHGDGFLSNINSDPTFWLGARYDGNARFVGNLDNVTYFQSALNGDEISNLYENQ